MKKLLGILVLGLLLSGNGYAETIESSDKHIWIYLPKGTPKNEAFSKRGIQYAKDHCIKHKKNTYSFSEGKNHDYDRLGFGRYQFRFICAKNKNEALENLKIVINNFSKVSVYQVKIDYPSIYHITLTHIEFQETKIAEKPKKQEPGLEIPDLKDSVWQTDFGRNDLIEFFSGGKCRNTEKKGSGRSFSLCEWSQDLDKIKISYDYGNFTFQAKMNGKRFEGSWKNKMTGKSGYGSGYAKTIVSWISSPAEKKPKISPDDNKIVPAGSGSGFIVSKDGTVITNYHVIEGCELNKVTYKGSQLEAKVLSIDKVNDIAILKTNINSDTAFAVSNEDVSLLEDVVVAGFPLGKQISSAIKTHKGVVTALAGAGDNYSFFQTDAAINQGNSGGPIINQKGNVIGIAVQTWVEEGVQGVHFGIKSSTLKTFASANGLKFLAPNNRDLSNKELGKLITESTVYVECHMTIANIKKMIAEEENKKAFYNEYK